MDLDLDMAPGTTRRTDATNSPSQSGDGASVNDLSPSGTADSVDGTNQSLPAYPEATEGSFTDVQVLDQHAVSEDYHNQKPESYPWYAYSNEFNHTMQTLPRSDNPNHGPGTGPMGDYQGDSGMGNYTFAPVYSSVPNLYGAYGYGSGTSHGGSSPISVCLCGKQLRDSIV